MTTWTHMQTERKQELLIQQQHAGPIHRARAQAKKLPRSNNLMPLRGLLRCRFQCSALLLLACQQRSVPGALCVRLAPWSGHAGDTAHSPAMPLAPSTRGQYKAKVKSA